MLKNLKLLRTETSTTQKQLADAIDVSQQSVNKYENHKIEPDIATLTKIADFFDTSIDYLVGRSELRRRIEPVTAYDLNDEEAALVDAYRRLDDAQKESIRLIVENYLKK